MEKEGISVDEMQRAEIEIVQHVQRQSFKEEFDTLQMKRDEAGPNRFDAYQETASCARKDTQSHVCKNGGPPEL